MERIKSFNEFSILEDANQASIEFSRAAAAAETAVGSGSSETSGGTGGTGGTGATSKSQEDYDKEIQNTFGDKGIVPGNDDYFCYMQHQQGIAGSSELLRTSKGEKTKKFPSLKALIGNVNNDAEMIRSITGAYQSGDLKTVATMFLNFWKRIYPGKAKSALSEIEKPKNAKIKEAISKAAAQYGIPFQFAATVAFIESGFNASAGNTRYKGLYAMDPSESYKGAVGTPLGSNWSNPELNANAGVSYLAASIKSLKSYLGSDLASLDLGNWVGSIT